MTTTSPDPNLQAVAPTPADVPAPVAPSRDFHHGLHRDGLPRRRGVLAIVCLLVGYAILSVLFSVLSVIADLALGTYPLERLQAGETPITPLALLGINLTGAALIPLSMLLQRAFFGVRAREQSSIAGGFRWRVLSRAALVIVPLWLALLVGLAVAGYPDGATELALDVSVPVLAVVLLTTWAQAAGEEYGFRGLMARAVGSWTASTRTAFVLSTVVANLAFMAAHLATDPWLLAYYFVFGACLSVITWRTGGLEVAVLVHAVNNLVFLGSVALFGGGELSMDRSVGSGGPEMLVLMAVGVLTAAVVGRWAGRRRTL